jgi:hypothetical protein
MSLSLPRIARKRRSYAAREAPKVEVRELQFPLDRNHDPRPVLTDSIGIDRLIIAATIPADRIAIRAAPRGTTRGCRD